MDNMNITLAANLQKYRKQSGLTQEELAEKLGVTFQAVSKWENAKSAPDIMLLPLLADLFGCNMDSLFSRELKAEIGCDRGFDKSIRRNPIRIDRITVGEKEYEAEYFGEQDMSHWSHYAHLRQFWRLKDVDCRCFHYRDTCDVLPYNNYPPILIEDGQVFVIDYHTLEGKVDRFYYIADGTVWQNMICTRRVEMKT